VEEGKSRMEKWGSKVADENDCVQDRRVRQKRSAVVCEKRNEGGGMGKQ
jgi:hypothetical protein